MRCLIIQKGVVINIAEVTPEVAAATGWPEAGIAQIGWKWIDGTAVPPERNIEAEWTAVRQQRSALLEDTVDRINPIRWEAMGSAERKAWVAYRQALLDLPSTFADPREVKFPVPPGTEAVLEPLAPEAPAEKPAAPLPVVIEPPVAESAPEPPAAEKPAAEQPVAEAPKPRRRRAHHDDGTFKADDPATPDKNEAFSE